MRGDEARIVEVFERHLRSERWAVDREVEFCDLVATKDACRLFVEAKGRTTLPGLGADTMYGQILRRMPIDTDDETAAFVVVVPSGPAERAALRVPERVRQLLRVSVYAVTDDDRVLGPL